MFYCTNSSSRETWLDGAQDARPSQQSNLSSNLSHISINDATSGGTRAEETGTAPLVASTASAPRGS